MNKKSGKGKIILLVIVALLAFGYLKSGIKKLTAPKKVTINSEEVYFSDWLDDNFEVSNDVTIEIDDKNKSVKFHVPLNCLKTPALEINELFGEGNEDLNAYKLTKTSFELNHIYLDPNEDDAKGKRDQKTVKDFLNLEEGETNWDFTMSCSEYDIEKIRKMKDLLITCDLQFDNEDKTIYIPWKVEEKQKEVVVEEPVQEEVVEEQQEEAQVEEEVIVEESNEVTPSFKEQMDAYEAFFDEYIALMESVQSDPTLVTSTKYIEFLGKYMEYTQALDNINEAELTDADYLYYLEVNTRIQEKLLKASS